MAQPRLRVKEIWWRNVQIGEFYNIERWHQIAGGGGSLYIEIPSSLVPDTLEFLGYPDVNVDSMPVITIEARVIGDPTVSGPIEFHTKKGHRMRIARQNRQAPSSQRHPAWTASRGFPIAPDDVRNKDEAAHYFPDGGLRIYLAKTEEGEFFAGFTKGPRPTGMKPSNPSWGLYPSSTRTPVGGVIRGGA